MATVRNHLWQKATPGHADAPARPSANDDFAMLSLLAHLLRHLAAVSRALGCKTLRVMKMLREAAINWPAGTRAALKGMTTNGWSCHVA